MGRHRKKLPLEICLEIASLEAQRDDYGADQSYIDASILKLVKLLDIDYLSSTFMPELQAQIREERERVIFEDLFTVIDSDLE